MDPYRLRAGHIFKMKLSEKSTAKHLSNGIKEIQIQIYLKNQSKKRTVPCFYGGVGTDVK
ncbi:MAG TPA: hypothetical protein DHV42_07165 [Lachnospiraceae bacterium]|nr:hypothetical protein [Lachnospiraceae bacterium]